MECITLERLKKAGWEKDRKINILLLIKRCFNPAVNHRLVTGGQENEFEDKECVSIDVAKCVAKRYYDSGEKDESFSWE